MSLSVQESNTCISASLLSRKCVPLLFDNVLISATINQDVIIKFIEDFNQEEVMLRGHENDITALGVSSSKAFLCSCSTDKVLIWNLHHILGYDKSNAWQPFCVQKKRKHAFSCCFSNDSHWLALAGETEITIIAIESLREYEIRRTSVYKTIITEATSEMLCCFAPSNDTKLVSINDSGVLKVWDVETGKMSHRAANCGTGCATFCKFENEEEPLLLIGTNAGEIQVYTLFQESLNLLHNIDIVKDLKKTFPRALDGNKIETESLSETDIVITERDCIIYSANILPCLGKEDIVQNHEASENESSTDLAEQGDFLNESDSSVVNEILSQTLLIVSCNYGILSYDCKSWIIVSFLPLSSIVSSKTCDVWKIFAEYILIGRSLENRILCMVKSLFDDFFSLFYLSVIYSGRKCDDSVQVISSSSIFQSSPLNKHILLPVDRISVYTNNQRAGTKKKTSSGYGKVSHRKLFQPQTNFSKNIKKSPAVYLNKFDIEEVSYQDFLKLYEVPKNVRKSVCMWSGGGVASRLAASSCGRHIACWSSSSEIFVLKFSELDKSKTFSLSGHDGIVNSASFNSDNELLLSASSDSSTKIWNWKQRKIILNIDCVAFRGKSAKIGSSTKVKHNPVTQAAFFYVDRFILGAVGEDLHLFSLTLHERARDSSHSYKLIHTVTMKDIQRITCFSALNTIQSYLIIIGCSNRNIKIYDLNSDKMCHELQDVHSRAPHYIRQLDGCRSVSHPAAVHNLIFTTSACDGVKLWDLRSCRCVQRFSQHSNRSYNMGFDVSPCCRFVAACSDDRHVYIYDTRYITKYVDKLAGLGDVAMDVAFNPCKPLLAAAGLNGNIVSFVP